MRIHQPIKDLVHFYAERLDDQLTPRIVDAESITTEEDARHVLDFCENMFELAMRLEHERVLFSGQPVKAYDAEKAHSVLSDLVSESGFEYLIED